MTMEDWSLTDKQREDTIDRICANVSAMAFFRSAPLAPQVVKAAAIAIEKKAYTVARVEARTTTGMRPHHETLKAYARKLSALVLEVVSSGGMIDGVAVATTPATADQGDGTELDLTGSREFLTKETAEELLAPMLKPGSNIQKIKFSTKSFGVEAAEVAARAIRNIASTLIDADMSDIIAGRPEDEALAALRIISDALSAAQLRHLNLSDNALGEKGIRACAASFQNQQHLESIAFQNVGCSVHGCAAVDELMKCTASLKRLHLLNNMSGDEGATSIANVLARCPVIEDFKMASSRVGAEGGAALAKALANAGSPSLVSLDIHDNPMTSEITQDLAHALIKHTTLKKLNLNDTCLGDEGVEAIAVALKKAAPGLEELELELNEITVSGCETLAAAIKSKTNLRKLNLRENELEDDGALTVAHAIAGLSSLQILDVCTNQIKRGGALALAKAVVSTDKPAFELLALDDNEISENGVEAVKAVLTKGGKLHTLGSLEENCPDDEDEDDVDDEGEDDENDPAVNSLSSALKAEHI